jgi:guanylate kinase
MIDLENLFADKDIISITVRKNPNGLLIEKTYFFHKRSEAIKLISRTDFGEYKQIKHGGTSSHLVIIKTQLKGITQNSNICINGKTKNID